MLTGLGKRNIVPLNTNALRNIFLSSKEADLLFNANQLDRLQRNADLGLRGRDHAPVKLFLPGTGCVWLVSALRGQGKNIRAYGLADFGIGSVRIGSTTLSKLEAMTDPLGIHRVQRDRHFQAQHKLSVYAYAAQKAGAFTEEEILLAEAAGYCAAFEQQRAVWDEPLPQDSLHFAVPQSQRSAIAPAPA